MCTRCINHFEIVMSLGLVVLVVGIYKGIASCVFFLAWIAWAIWCTTLLCHAIQRPKFYVWVSKCGRVGVTTCQFHSLCIVCNSGWGMLVAKRCSFCGFPCIGHIKILRFV